MDAVPPQLPEPDPRPLPPWDPNQTLEQKAEAMKSGRLLAALKQVAPVLSQQEIVDLYVQLLRIEAEQRQEEQRGT